MGRSRAGEERKTERLWRLDLWGRFREHGRGKERQAGKRSFELFCIICRIFSHVIFSRNCSEDVNCPSITIYLRVIRRWSTAQGDKAVYGSHLHAQGLPCCLSYPWGCISWIYQRREFKALSQRSCPHQLPSFPKHHPRTLQKTQVKGAKSFPLRGESCGNYHFLSFWSSMKGLRQRR